MLFSSPVFVFIFLPIIILINLLLPIKLSNIWLLLASLVFYAWGEPVYIILLLISSLVNYFFAILIKKNDEKKPAKKAYLTLNIIFNLGLLGVFKYSNFVIDTINNLLNTNIDLVDIALPIGISFYTFQTMSYVIDVYRNKVEVQNSYPKLLLYISFFPQLIAGPIVKYRDIEREIDNRTVNLNKMTLGMERFIIGLGKKMLISNTMAFVADSIYALEAYQINAFVVLIGAISYMLQIYFDFSGYSDMAIGLGKIFGFNFLENFNHPYISQSIQEFWRRWHISLSTWFKEYVYIPLGGNRKGKFRTVLNKIIVFFLTGLWHGASWNFVVWGLFNGLFLLLEELVLKLKKWPRFIRHIYTITIVLISFIFFRADTMSQALDFIGGLTNFSTMSPEVSGLMDTLINVKFIFILILAIIGSTPLVKRLLDRININLKFIFLIIVWILCLLNLSAATYNPFIYFRF
ncbi:MBOAT family O-acyltransferase [uncultured Helcococcus sp.]|uniref:MBOAT family O-acyltransferase n=1 Tax=uncultured Helcococcus sp. TaxID=1072508 RepID=UPI002603B6A5|nr:MBOAT family O-acyltransferase [uncultured Helcococcus sp.]